MDNKCIRVLADKTQIKQCQEEIKEINNSVSQFSKVFNLAGNGVRLKILYLLHREGKMCPCDLSDVLSMTVPAVSQHLRKMKDAQIVFDKRVGQTIFYSIMEENAKIILPVLSELYENKNKKELIK